MNVTKLREEIAKYRQEIRTDRVDMSFGEIINMYKDQEIIISPEYQRAFRWDIQRQTDFIESILLGIPFPPVFVATREDGKWELVDGLQRISTVLSFFGELKDVAGQSYSKNNLKLSGGGLLKDLDNLCIDDLPLEYKLQIKRTPCRIEVILKESDFKMKYELFKRLNTGGEGLSRQEIRNCIFRGIDNTYNAFINEMAQNANFRTIIHINPKDEAMMYYEELVLRFLSLKNDGTRYRQANIEDFLDDYMEEKSKVNDLKKIENDRKIFNDIVTFLFSLNNDEIFKLATLPFTTSMYDAVMLSLSTVKSIATLDGEKFLRNINELKNNGEFKKYVGSASSHPTSITHKVEVATEILLK
jgi:hypothetical protein